MEEEIITEETTIDVVGVIPAHLKEFENLSIDSASPSNIYISIDGNKLKGKIADTTESNLFFMLDKETKEAKVISSADKTVTFENIFYIPKEEFQKTFVPTDAVKKPE